MDNMNTEIRAEDILGAVLAAAICFGLFACALVAGNAPQDFTDSGVGCVNDCFELISTIER